VRCWRGCKRALERAVGGDKPARGRWRPGTCAGGAERLGQDRTRSDKERQGLLHLEAGSAVRRRCSDSESSGSDARSTSSAAAAAKQAFAKPVSARLLGRAVVGLFVARSRAHHPSLDLRCSPSGLPVPAPSQRAPGSAAGAEIARRGIYRARRHRPCTAPALGHAPACQRGGWRVRARSEGRGACVRCCSTGLQRRPPLPSRRLPRAVSQHPYPCNYAPTVRAKHRAVSNGGPALIALRSSRPAAPSAALSRRSAPLSRRRRSAHSQPLAARVGPRPLG